jgi:hypothetical protein
MPVSWMRTQDADPDASFPGVAFVTLDGEEIIGRVHQIRHGTDKGPWFWSMTVSPPGPAFSARSGMEARRDDAGRRVVEAHEAMLRRTRGWKLQDPRD